MDLQEQIRVVNALIKEDPESTVKTFLEHRKEIEDAERLFNETGSINATTKTTNNGTKFSNQNGLHGRACEAH